MPPSAKILKKLYPDRWSVAALLVTPSGSEIRIETDLPEDLGQQILDLLTEHLASGLVLEESNAS